MKLLNYLVSVQIRHCILARTNVCRNFCSTTAYSEGPVGSSLRIFMCSNKRNFITHSLIFRNQKSQYSNEIKSNEERSRFGKQGIMVSVIDENNVESIMTLIDAEKLAKRKNLKLVPHESSRKDKVKYKLEKSFISRELKKGKDKDKKKVVLREETQPHDVEIKINQMMKFLDKGLKVICVIEGSGNKESIGNVLQLIEQSKLKAFLISTVKTKRSVVLNYEPQSQAAEKEKKTQQEEDKE